jgi:hypothetical protein
MLLNEFSSAHINCAGPIRPMRDQRAPPWNPSLAISVNHLRAEAGGTPTSCHIRETPDLRKSSSFHHAFAALPVL